MLAATDKYALNRLKAMCENALMSSLTVNNVSEILHVADFCTVPMNSKSFVVNFINIHTKDMIEAFCSIQESL